MEIKIVERFALQMDRVTILSLCVGGGGISVLAVGGVPNGEAREEVLSQHIMEVGGVARSVRGTLGGLAVKDDRFGLIGECIPDLL